MLRLTAMKRRVTVGLALCAILASGLVVGRAARNAGAFGCEYRDRDRLADWRLSASRASTLRVRRGEGVRLVSPDEGMLRDVLVNGSARLAPGTQNGVRDYVYRVTAHGSATAEAKTAADRRVTGTLRATC